MAYYRIVSNKSKYYPVAVSNGKPVSPEQLAKMISKRCSLTKADVLASLTMILEVAAECLAQGQAVDLGRLGTLKLKLCSRAVDSPEDFNFQRDVTATRVQLVPARRRCAGKKRYTRDLLDLEKIKWLPCP